MVKRASTKDIRRMLEIPVSKGTAAPGYMLSAIRSQLRRAEKARKVG